MSLAYDIANNVVKELERQRGTPASEKFFLGYACPWNVEDKRRPSDHVYWLRVVDGLTVQLSLAAPEMIPLGMTRPSQSFFNWLESTPKADFSGDKTLKEILTEFPALLHKENARRGNTRREGLYESLPALTEDQLCIVHPYWAEKCSPWKDDAVHLCEREAVTHAIRSASEHYNATGQGAIILELGVPEFGKLSLPDGIVTHAQATVPIDAALQFSAKNDRLLPEPITGLDAITRAQEALRGKRNKGAKELRQVLRAVAPYTSDIQELARQYSERSAA